METKQRTSFVCWVDDREKILSFHLVEGFERKVFKTKPEFQDFMMLLVSRGYKVQ